MQSQRLLEPMAVIGAGSWGTALAIQLSRAGHPTHLWGRDPAQLDAMRRARCNERYLSDAAFPPALTVAADLGQALHDVRDALIAVPSHAFRATLRCEVVRPHLSIGTRVAWATKGFEIPSGLLPHQVASEVLGARPGAVLSGPTFAKEVGAGLPTAMTVASRDPEFAKALASRFVGPAFPRLYQNDIMGVEVGGAVKNVIAIGSGIADGMGFGANTRVALITRGLAEMMRLGVKLGAARETFMGLAGLGDLVLTCTDDQSRNRRLGLALGRGRSMQDAQGDIHQVIEGVLASQAVCAVADRLAVDMPICREIFPHHARGQTGARGGSGLDGPRAQVGDGLIRGRYRPHAEARQRQRTSHIAGGRPAVSRRDGQAAEPRPDGIGDVECGMIERRGQTLRVAGDIHQSSLQHRRQGAADSDREHIHGHQPEIRRRQRI